MTIEVPTGEGQRRNDPKSPTPSLDYSNTLPDVKTATNPRYSGHAVAASITSTRSEPEDTHDHALILVIDDEEVVRSVTKRILERFGFSVLLAPNGSVGLELFQRLASDIACVLLDLSMPRLSGDELFHEICRIKPDARVVLMSGYPEEIVSERFHSQALPYFLVKPFSAQDLHTKICQVINA